MSVGQKKHCQEWKQEQEYPAQYVLREQHLIDQTDRNEDHDAGQREGGEGLKG